MTNKEIMQASLLDIVFDNRNKAYGAYALRRYYPNRLLIALSTALSLALLFWLLSSFLSKKGEITHSPFPEERMITVIEIPPVNKPEPQQQNNPQTQQVAQVDYQPLIIVPNEQVINDLVTIDDIRQSVVSNTTVGGIPETSTVIINNNHVSNTGNDQEETSEPQQEIFSSTDPEYPGGRDALVRFLEMNLIVPDELEVGNRKTVQVKFKINEEGKISDIEIAKSAGESFDKEVIRVCKKMKRWKPATQNGKSVSTTFLLPVTFVATEQ